MGWETSIGSEAGPRQRQGLGGAGAACSVSEASRGARRAGEVHGPVRETEATEANTAQSGSWAHARLHWGTTGTISWGWQRGDLRWTGILGRGGGPGIGVHLHGIFLHP